MSKLVYTYNVQCAYVYKYTIVLPVLCFLTRMKYGWENKLNLKQAQAKPEEEQGYHWPLLQYIYYMYVLSHLHWHTYFTLQSFASIDRSLHLLNVVFMLSCQCK